MFKLTYILGNTVRDITGYTSNYTRSDNIDALGQEFKFDLMCNPLDKYYKNTLLEIGGKIQFENNGIKVFTGIITDQSRSGVTGFSYTAYDFCYYLNKNEVMIQFNDVAASGAIQQICVKYNIKVGNICYIATNIKKIYNGLSVSDAIKDILKQAQDESGNKYRLEVRGNSLYIEPYSQLIIDAKYKPAPNLNEFDVTLVPGGYSSSKSIKDTKNNIVIISSNEESNQIYGQAADYDSQNKFGLLTHVEKIQDKDSAKANQIAKTKLAELNQVKEEINLNDLFGDDNIRSGRTLKFNQPNIDMVGDFLILNCTHKYAPNLHTMSLKFKREL